MLRQIQSSVQRGDEWCREPGKEGEGIVVEVEVEDVELVGALSDGFEHRHVQRVRIAHLAVETQCTRPARHECSLGHGVAAGEQRHVVAEFDERFRQP
jgi:hypothetical protein